MASCGRCNLRIVSDICGYCHFTKTVAPNSHALHPRGLVMAVAHGPGTTWRATAEAVGRRRWDTELVWSGNGWAAAHRCPHQGFCDHFRCIIHALRFRGEHGHPAVEISAGTLSVEVHGQQQQTGAAGATGRSHLMGIMSETYNLPVKFTVRA